MFRRENGTPERPDNASGRSNFDYERFSTGMNGIRKGVLRDKKLWMALGLITLTQIVFKCKHQQFLQKRREQKPVEKEILPYSRPSPYAKVPLKERARGSVDAGLWKSNNG